MQQSKLFDGKAKQVYNIKRARIVLQEIVNQQLHCDASGTAAACCVVTSISATRGQVERQSYEQVKHTNILSICLAIFLESR